MAENNIKLIAINPRGQLTYTLESPDSGNIKLKKAQYNLSENILGIRISKELIISKMKNQKATLTTLNKNKQLKRVYNHRLKIDECITQLEELTLNGKKETMKMTIMGLEGKTSNEYWQAGDILYQKKLVLAQEQKSQQICSIQCLTTVMQYLQVKLQKAY